MSRKKAAGGVEKLTHCLISSNALNEKGVDCWQLTWHTESPPLHISHFPHISFPLLKFHWQFYLSHEQKVFVAAKIFVLVRENW